MGYDTEFFGEFEFSQALTENQRNYLTLFSKSRRMGRYVRKLPNDLVNDSARIAVGLPYGKQGEFVVNDDDNFGQT